MTKMNKQKILSLFSSWSLVPVFHLDKASHLQPGNHLRLSRPFKENSLFPYHGLTYNANVLHYLVNIIVVNGLVELVVEIIQELDSLSGSTANKVALIFEKQHQNLDKKSFSHKKLVKVSIYLWAVSLVKPTISPKKRVVFSYILHITCNVLTHRIGRAPPLQPYQGFVKN